MRPAIATAHGAARGQGRHRRRRFGLVDRGGRVLQREYRELDRRRPQLGGAARNRRRRDRRFNQPAHGENVPITSPRHLADAPRHSASTALLAQVYAALEHQLPWKELEKSSAQSAAFLRGICALVMGVPKPTLFAALHRFIAPNCSRHDLAQTKPTTCVQRQRAGAPWAARKHASHHPAGHLSRRCASQSFSSRVLRRIARACAALRTERCFRRVPSCPNASELRQAHADVCAPTSRKIYTHPHTTGSYSRARDGSRHPHRSRLRRQSNVGWARR